MRQRTILLVAKLCLIGVSVATGMLLVSWGLFYFLTGTKVWPLDSHTKLALSALFWGLFLLGIALAGVIRRGGAAGDEAEAGDV